MEFVSKLFDIPPESRVAAAVATTIVTTAALFSLARWSLYPTRGHVIAGPLTTTIPKLSKDELAKVTYLPDHFPGGRDVITPYGNIHVYEFGPEDGRKVLLLHGISTSCMTLAGITHDLVAKGCRVMLFDLFGRGYTDGVGDLPFDTRLYITQILLVLASSHLPWTGDGAFSLIGYSLGGAISVNFAATFPHLVSSLVLLAPAGLIRAGNIGSVSRLIFTSGIVPGRILEALAKRRLRSPIGNAVSNKKRSSAADDDQAPPKETLTETVVQEAVDPGSADNDASARVELLEADNAAFVRWQLDGHKGMVPALMSTFRFGPTMGQHAYWRLLAARKPGTTAVILGRHDEIVHKDDYEEDALPLIGGRDNVFWRVVPGGHNFPFTNSSDALEAIYEFWGLDVSV